MLDATARWHGLHAHASALQAGLRFGARGTHSSRTMMLAELGDVLAAVPGSGSRLDYAVAAIDDNVAGKATASARRLTHKRLRELYGLDPAVPIFRVLRRLWAVDESGRPTLALLCALARDPLLRLSAPTVLGLQPGQELVRSALVAAVAGQTGERLNEAVVDKVARNSASSWTQSGHLRGRMRKIRSVVEPTPGSLAFALWLSSLDGHTGVQMLRAAWATVFDRGPQRLLDAALTAQQLHLLHVRLGGDVVEIDASGLDPATHRGRP